MQLASCSACGRPTPGRPSAVRIYCTDCDLARWVAWTPQPGDVVYRKDVWNPGYRVMAVRGSGPTRELLLPGPGGPSWRYQVLFMPY